ncbi:MFS transporter [Labrys wisconsinensis]|uniref:MFS family permease n=1 Tax=Labrys wisconsinensis TaxID=425677 RepID=A0ABU0JJS3_9HYPH|nr:MFS transporter [Labrys wisconsinensis]MDQ0474534.1 MFS family permease [Labrys wisconsinensis]
MPIPVSRRRLALFAFFFLPGVSMASWVTRTPAIRDSVGASIAEMGLVLLGVSFGSMGGILSSGPLVARFGSRPVTHVGLWLVVAAMAMIAAGVVLGTMGVVAFGLGLFGLGMGLSEIAINIDGADIERLTGRPLLHALHGFYSLGTVCGALIGLALTAISFPVAWHLAIIGALGSVLILSFMRFMPYGIGREDRAAVPARPGGSEAAPAALWQDQRLLLIGLIVLAMALAEGAANDWLPILMVDEYGFSQTSGSLIFLGFALAMTVGRFSGGVLLGRFGRAAVIRGSAVLGALGIALVVFAENPILGGSAVVLWGLGASLGFPIALSAAGDSGADGAARIRLVATGGYVAFLVGPPLLGFTGEAYGLRSAMLIVLALIAIALAIAPAVGPPEARAGRPAGAGQSL